MWADTIENLFEPGDTYIKLATRIGPAGSTLTVLQVCCEGCGDGRSMRVVIVREWDAAEHGFEVFTQAPGRTINEAREAMGLPPSETGDANRR